MRLLRRFSAAVIGFVFFIAGFLKLMDPVGAGLVVESWLGFFGLSALIPAAKAFGMIMALAETLTGAALITGVWRKAVGIVTLCLTGLFTVMTAILLISGRDMDCGCFGEALHLTPLQTFLKNIVLLLLWAAAFLPLSDQQHARKVKYVSFSVAALSVALFMLYSALSIPLMDFTDYRPGAELDENSLSFCDVSGEYADSLALGERVAIISVYRPQALSEQRWERIGEALERASRAGYTPLLLVSAAPSALEAIPGAADFLDRCYFADRRELMTLNRSNGGFSCIMDAQVSAKWPGNKLPGVQELSALAALDPTEAFMTSDRSPRMKAQAFLLYIFSIMLLL